MTDQLPATSAGKTLSMPMAIIIAGALVALAIYFSASGKVSNTADVKTGQPAASPVAAAPSEPPIGDFRPVDTAKDHIRGNANAKVTLLEYSDLECPFCKQFHKTLQDVLAAYPNDVRWVFRHAPLVQLHSQAPAEANAAECASEQGKFWEFIDKVFATTPGNNGLDLAQLPVIAKQVGVNDIAKFNDCVKSEKYKAVVQADLDDANKAGMRGTPYTVAISANGTKEAINGAYPIASVKATVDGLLKK